MQTKEAEYIFDTLAAARRQASDLATQADLRGDRDDKIKWEATRDTCLRLVMNFTNHFPEIAEAFSTWSADREAGRETKRFQVQLWDIDYVGFNDPSLPWSANYTVAALDETEAVRLAEAHHERLTDKVCTFGETEVSEVEGN